MHLAIMPSLRILLLLFCWNEIFTDAYIDNCSIKSNDYALIENVDYQPTNSLLMLQQFTLMSKEFCGLKCLANALCFTATFKSNTGQCTLYFEQMIDQQLISLSGGYVMSATGQMSGLSKWRSFFSPSDPIYSIWNSGVGRSSSPSSQGFGVGQYPPSQSALFAIDRLRTTTYVNYGNTSQYANSTIGGINSGFYITPNLGAPSVLTQFRIATGSDYPSRDPLVVSIEGSNGGNLTQGSSWTLIYNGSTGLETDPGRETFSPLLLVPNTKSFRSYRLLTVAKRWVVDCVQYSEVEFYGYTILC